jgi:hypothetical protein
MESASCGWVDDPGSAEEAKSARLHESTGGKAMKYTAIRMLRTTYDFSEDMSAVKVHESIFRSYQILEKVKDLLRANTPPDVVMELIEFMETNP